MKVSVVMVDGGFRESIHAARTFSQQTFPEDEFEVLWVEYFDRPHKELSAIRKTQTICLNRGGTYHSSYAFNEGIRRAKGDIVVIPDADLVAPKDFLFRLWERHLETQKLALYAYRYDELTQNSLQGYSIAELESKCALKNPMNYGGCLSVRRRWLLELNGYEQHPIFQSGNHANGLDMAVRFKNFGLAIQWDPTLRLYHPWHPSTLMHTDEHRSQERLIEWRRGTTQWRAFKGIDPSLDSLPPDPATEICRQECQRLGIPIPTDTATPKAQTNKPFEDSERSFDDSLQVFLQEMNKTSNSR